MVKAAASGPTADQASNGDFLAQMAVEGLGFMVVTRFVVDEYLANGTLQRIMTDHTWHGLDLHVVYPATRLITRRTEAFIEVLTALLSGQKIELLRNFYA